MVVAHVLIHAESHAGALASRHHFLRVPVIRRQRLLRQDPADVLVLKRRVHNGRLRGGRNRDVENLNPVVRQKFLPGVIDLRDSSQFRGRARLLGVLGSNRHHIEARILVSHKMNVAHDKARANGANPIILLAREERAGAPNSDQCSFDTLRVLSPKWSRGHLPQHLGPVILRPAATESTAFFLTVGSVICSSDAQSLH